MAVLVSPEATVQGGELLLDLEAHPPGPVDWDKARATFLHAMRSLDVIFPPRHEVVPPAPTARTRGASRPRERKATGGRGAHSPPSGDGPRRCCVCETSLEGRRSHAITCSDRCRKDLQRRQLLCEQEIDDAIAATADPADALVAAVVRLSRPTLAAAA